MVDFKGRPSSVNFDNRTGGDPTARDERVDQYYMENTKRILETYLTKVPPLPEPDPRRATLQVTPGGPKVTVADFRKQQERNNWIWSRGQQFEEGLRRKDYSPLSWGDMGHDDEWVFNNFGKLIGDIFGANNKVKDFARYKKEGYDAASFLLDSYERALDPIDTILAAHADHQLKSTFSNGNE